MPRLCCGHQNDLSITSYIALLLRVQMVTSEKDESHVRYMQVKGLFKKLQVDFQAVNLDEIREPPILQ